MSRILRAFSFVTRRTPLARSETPVDGSPDGRSHQVVKS
jgi:hypothetical protein